MEVVLAIVCFAGRNVVDIVYGRLGDV
jgi:hypothetical protein